MVAHDLRSPIGAVLELPRIVDSKMGEDDGACPTRTSIRAIQKSLEQVPHRIGARGVSSMFQSASAPCVRRIGD